MKVIWKYEFTKAGRSEFLLPIGADILSVQSVNDRLVFYALVDPKQEVLEMIYFYVVATGEEVSDSALSGMIYRGTSQVKNGFGVTFVWHIYQNILK
jgi:hypothetical protein